MIQNTLYLNGLIFIDLTFFICQRQVIKHSVRYKTLGQNAAINIKPSGRSTYKLARSHLIQDTRIFCITNTACKVLCHNQNTLRPRLYHSRSLVFRWQRTNACYIYCDKYSHINFTQKDWQKYSSHSITQKIGLFKSIK